MRVLSMALACLTLAGAAKADPVEFRSELHQFRDTSTTLDSFVSVGALREIRRDLHFGLILYSAAGGDAGGLFVGGVELAKRWRVTDGL